MSRSRKLAIAALLTIAPVWGCVGAQDASLTRDLASSRIVEADTAGSPKPNVLLITVDTLRADYVGAYGNGWIHTPTLDALATQGARFTMHISNFPQTNPAHASMLTGAYPATHQLKHHFVDHVADTVPTLAETLAAAGYATAGIFSWPSFEPQYSGLNRGFSYYKGAYVPVPGETYIERAFDGRADVTTDAALQWLASRPGGPFFLWVHYMDPHFPYTPPAPYDWIYDPCSDCIDGSYDSIDAIVNGRVLSEKDLRHLKALYAGEVSFTDREIGRLLAGIKSAGTLDHTILVITADHGESFGENGRWFHPSVLYNTVEHLPLIVVYPPAIPPGSVVDAVTQSIDIMPTLLNLVITPVPNTVEGRDLMTLVRGEDPGSDRAAFTETYDEASDSMVTKGWKLIRDNTNGGLELYDLGADPGEAYNQATSRPDLASPLEQQLTSWLSSHGIAY